MLTTKARTFSAFALVLGSASLSLSWANNHVNGSLNNSSRSSYELVSDDEAAKVYGGQNQNNCTNIVQGNCPANATTCSSGPCSQYKGTMVCNRPNAYVPNGAKPFATCSGGFSSGGMTCTPPNNYVCGTSIPCASNCSENSNGTFGCNSNLSAPQSDYTMPSNFPSGDCNGQMAIHHTPQQRSLAEFNGIGMIWFQ